MIIVEKHSSCEEQTLNVFLGGNDLDKESLSVHKQLSLFLVFKNFTQNLFDIPLNEEFFITEINRKTDRVFEMSLVVVHPPSQIKDQVASSVVLGPCSVVDHLG